MKKTAEDPDVLIPKNRGVDHYALPTYERIFTTGSKSSYDKNNESYDDNNESDDDYQESNGSNYLQTKPRKQIDWW